MISLGHNHTFFCHLIWLYQGRMMVVVKPPLPDFCAGKRHYITAKNDLLFWQLHLSPELQLWCGFKRWCKISPLWQPSMGNATHVEYSNNWNLPLQRSSPLCKLIGHFNHTVVTLQVYRDWLRKTPVRQLAHITSLTILGTFTRSLQLHSHGKLSCPWWQQVTPLQMFSG